MVSTHARHDGLHKACLQWELWTSSNDGCGAACASQAAFKRGFVNTATLLEKVPLLSLSQRLQACSPSLRLLADDQAACKRGFVNTATLLEKGGCLGINPVNVCTHL